MLNLRYLSKSPLSTMITGLLAILVVICVVYSPGEAFQASGVGLTIWWRVVFPALLPFVVLSQILLARGFAHGLGALLDPFTRRLLGLPGYTGWVLALGMTAGFPAAADAAATLYKQGQMSSREAERITAVSHFCSPMLLVIVIGAGFVGRPQFGLLLLAIHWAAGLLAGITLHQLWPERPELAPPGSEAMRLENSKPSPGQQRTSRFRLALRRMEQARQEDGRTFGKLLGESVASGVQTLMVIGGYMLIFAVILHVLLLALPSQPVFVSLLKSSLEVHLGTFALSELSPAPIAPALAAALLGVVLGWSGVCAYLQVRAILSPAGIHERTFLISRLLHGIYAYVLTLLLWKPFIHWLPGIVPAFSSNRSFSLDSNAPASWLPDWQLALGVMKWQLSMLGLLIFGLAAIAMIWRKPGPR